MTEKEVSANLKEHLEIQHLQGESNYAIKQAAWIQKRDEMRQAVMTSVFSVGDCVRTLVVPEGSVGLPIGSVGVIDEQVWAQPDNRRDLGNWQVMSWIRFELPIDDIDGNTWLAYDDHTSMRVGYFEIMGEFEKLEEEKEQD